MLREHPHARGSLADPEVYENVPGHVIPILEREFDDFDTQARRFLDGETPPEEFIGFRLRQGVYGQRQAERQMIRVKLPFGGVNPEQLDAFADVVERYVPLRKGHITTRQNVQLHHVPLTDAASADPRDLARPGSRRARAAATRSATSPATRGPGVCENELLRPDALRRRLRALLRAQRGLPADAAQVQDRVQRDRRGRRDHRHPRRRLPAADRRRPPRLRAAHRRRHVDHAAHRADALRVRRRRRRRVPEGDGGGAADLQPPGRAARQPRPRPHQGADRPHRHGRLPRDGRGGAARRLGRRARLRPGAAAVPTTTRRRARRRRAAHYASPNGDAREFERFAAANTRPQRQEGFVTVEVRIPRGDLTPEQFRGLAQIMREHSGGYARTTVQQNLVLRWVRDGVGLRGLARARRARPRRRSGRARSPTSSAAPAPTAASSGSRARWA